MVSSLFDISGRVALVTGASRGIGRMIAQGLAEAGASIALSSRTESDLLKIADKIRALGVRAETFPADVARVTEIQALVRDVLVRMGQIDILVNVAGFEPSRFLSGNHRGRLGCCARSESERRVFHLAGRWPILDRNAPVRGRA